MLDQSGNFRDWFAGAGFVTVRPHTLGEVEPHLVMWASALQSFFVGQVIKHGAAEFAFREASVERAEIGREGGDVMVILSGISAQIIARERAFAPGLIERMAKQIVV